MPAVHQFASSKDAYDWSNVGAHPDTDAKINDGDVLVVASEGIVGFLYEAWPVAIVFPGWDGQVGAVSDDGDEDVHPEVGAFHWTTPNDGKPEHPLNRYNESVKLALATAQSDADITGNEHWVLEAK